jgi:hypothetical protein
MDPVRRADAAMIIGTRLSNFATSARSTRYLEIAGEEGETNFAFPERIGSIRTIETEVKDEASTSLPNSPPSSVGDKSPNPQLGF